MSLCPVSDAPRMTMDLKLGFLTRRDLASVAIKWA